MKTSRLPLAASLFFLSATFVAVAPAVVGQFGSIKLIEPSRTTRVSVNADLTEPNGNSLGAYLSSDGRYAVYRSRADLTSDDLNGVNDAYITDRDSDENGTFDEPGGVAIIRISIDELGVGETGGCGCTDISDDGRYVTMGCHGDEFSPIDNNLTTDIFVKDRDADENGIFDEPGAGNTAIIIVTKNEAGVVSNDKNFDSRLSATGRYAVFQSKATNYDAIPDLNGDHDIFVHDRDADDDGVFDEAGEYTLTRVTINNSGVAADGVCRQFEISADASLIIYNSDSTNLWDQPDLNGVEDVFLRDRELGTTILLSLAENGDQGDGDSLGPDISDDGRWVVFKSDATNFVADDGNLFTDIFLLDRDSDENGIFDEPGGRAITRISEPPGGGDADDHSFGVQISADGGMIVYASDALNILPGVGTSRRIYMYDRETGQTKLAVDGNDDSRLPAISDDGRSITFDSYATDLVASDQNNDDDCFVRPVCADFPRLCDIRPALPAPYEVRPLHVFRGDIFGSQFGLAVEVLGDVNHDGHADVIVGSPFDDDGLGIHQGSATVYSGFDGSVIYTYVGDDENDNYGWDVDGAGDVNADTYADFVISARYNDDNGGNAGSIYIYSGFDGTLLHRFDGDSPGDQFGFSAAGAGDVNNDGFDDLIVGARYDDDFADDAGSARVFSGEWVTKTAAAEAPLTAEIFYTFHGMQETGLVGWSVGDAGDVNMDGFDDVIVSAHRNNTGAPGNTGSAFVYSGQDGSVLHQFDGNSAQDRFGFDVEGVGDVDGDGHGDVIIGAPQELVGVDRVGRVYVYSGQNGDLLYMWEGTFDQSEFGFAVDGAGDVDGDGIPDFLVGQRYGAPGLSGNAHLYSGADGSRLLRFVGRPEDLYGCAVGGGGDVNGDGLSDIILGGPEGELNTPDGNGYAKVISPVRGIF